MLRLVLITIHRPIVVSFRFKDNVVDAIEVYKPVESILLRNMLNFRNLESSDCAQEHVIPVCA